MTKSRQIVSTVLAGLLLPATLWAADANWPRWRGPNQDGHTSETGLPVKWDKSSIEWKTPLKGEGQSSPVIWGERIFLTRSENKGAKRFVLCINRNDGRILWEKLAWTGTPERSHHMNGWASATTVTDGKHVYAFFGRGGGLFCYTLDGELVWTKNLGRFQIDSGWGTAASPVLVGDVVVQNCDADADSYIIGLNKATGEQVWKTTRPNVRGWSTPILIESGTRRELVVNGDKGAQAYDPKTGKDLWFCKSFNGRGTPTVTPSKAGLLHVVNGKPGDTYAIKPGGSGDVTKTHMAWHSRRIGGRDLGSPIAIGNYLLVSSMSGVVACYDTAKGNMLWNTRLSGKFSTSPIAYQGMAAFINEAGETFLVKPGEKPTIVGSNSVPADAAEIFRSAITPSDGQLFIRSTGALYCIGKRKPAKK